MAGSIETERETEAKKDDCCFIWDESTHLYFHASDLVAAKMQSLLPRNGYHMLIGSGFYHDPNAGWYYSSSDGIYYKFENGSYVPLQSNEIVQVNDCGVSGEETNTASCNDDYVHDELPVNTSSLVGDQLGISFSQGNGSNPRHEDCNTNQAEFLRPTSEWLEDTLINLYMSGYNQAVDPIDGVTKPSEMDYGDGVFIYRDGTLNNDADMLEGDSNTLSHRSPTNLGESSINEDVSQEEEKWLAQYGQVVHSGEEPVCAQHTIDLWDWAVVSKNSVSRLVGRVVKRSAKLHPAMSSRHGLFKTAPICEVSSDLVRVTTGKIYKLRTPSAQYLASLSTYDSSNPTRDWDFPELSVYQLCFPGADKLISSDGNVDHESASLSKYPSEKLTSHAYRDRAAERRTLHGGYGVGPGQKSSPLNNADSLLSFVSISTEEAAAEALNMSLGPGSYARKLLENMGWKEGEGLGTNAEGLVEPIQPIANVGNAGLGWPHVRTKHK